MGDSQRIQVPAFITAVALVFMVMKDLTIGGIDYGWYHIVGKTFFFGACLGIGFYARWRVRDPSPRLMVAIILVVILNCAHSLSYEPSFHAGYNTTLLLALFVYNKSTRGFVGLLAFSYVLLVVTLFASGVQPGPAYVKDWRTNVLIDHLVISLIIWFIYLGIFKQIQERELLYGQYLDIGRKTSMIVHDLKGGLASPLLYVDIARERATDPKSREVLGKLRDDLEFLKHYAQELSEFTASSESTEKEFFRLSDLTRSLTILAASELANILIVLEQDYELHLNKNLLRRVLMNVFLNASEVNRADGKTVTVTIKVDGDRIIVQDDGPGFPQDVLRKIGKGQSVTTKETGSGLGCRIIAEYTKLLGGKAKFGNSPAGGAYVELELAGSRMEPLSESRLEVRDVAF